MLGYPFLDLLGSPDLWFIFPNKEALISAKHVELKRFYLLYYFFFLLLTLLYNVTFGQILIQFLMKNLAIKILIMFSCWNINKTINFLWSYESSLSIRVNSHFLQVWLAWNFCVLHHGPTRVEELIFGGTYVFLDHFNC